MIGLLRFPVRRAVLALACLAAASLRTSAEVQLASPFSSHMVLQREMPVPVWGKAAQGERVTVEFGGQSKTATADSSGAWRVDLDPLTASAEPRTFLARGSQTEAPVRLDDVLVGEVWLGSGQSNMDFRISKARASWAGVDDEEKVIAEARHPLIRIFTGDPVRAYTPQATLPGTWQVCSPETAPNFSAVAYFFARELQSEINVPVGIVVLSYGASCAQAWIRRDVMEQDPEFKTVLDAFDASVRNFKPATDQELAAWREAADRAKADGRRAPRKPGQDPVQDQHNPTVLYNGMIAPVVPFALRGVLWYQGESITAPKELFPRWNEALIRDWRTLWGRELPFYFCQLAALENSSNSPQVREWQAEALRIANTAMVVTIDIGDRKNVHPKNKLEVGRRLARIALARDYGRKLEYSGPLFTSASRGGAALRIHFSHTSGGLVARDGTLKCFEVRGADGTWLPAEAKIDRDTVVVSAAAVAAPAAARYAWANYPEGANLFNGAGLPAAPFRTDAPTSP